MTSWRKTVQTEAVQDRVHLERKLTLLGSSPEELHSPSVPNMDFEKIAEGKSAEVMMQPANMESAETPPVRDFMKELQRDGTKLLADDVYTETYQWLKERSCEKIVSRQLVEQYAMSISRWIHCEQIVTKYGYISKHPTTGAAIASPYVAMSQNYMKQANQIWNQIFQIVRENCSVEFQGNPQEDMMEKLLRSRK